MKGLFRDFSVLPTEINGLMVARERTFDHTKHMIEKLNAATEQWVRKAIEAGPGWNVWRSDMETKPDDAFVMVWHFQLVPPGAMPPGKGLLFTQPEFTDGERVRLLAGRHDWREGSWEDECGVVDCEHRCCAVYWGRSTKGKI